MKNFNLGGSISGNNALQPQETGWGVIEGGKTDTSTTWDGLKGVAHGKFKPQGGEKETMAQYYKEEYYLEFPDAKTVEEFAAELEKRDESLGE